MLNVYRVVQNVMSKRHVWMCQVIRSKNCIGTGRSETRQCNYFVTVAQRKFVSAKYLCFKKSKYKMLIKNVAIHNKYSKCPILVVFHAFHRCCKQSQINWNWPSIPPTQEELQRSVPCGPWLPKLLFCSPKIYDIARGKKFRRFR